MPKHLMLPEMDNVELDTTFGISESDCCGNGCANCILDVGLKKSPTFDRLGKQNVISNYCSFQLLDKCFHQPSGCNNSTAQELTTGLELHFVCALKSKPTSDYTLDIPSGHHVMLRANLSSGELCLRPYSPFWVDALAMEFKILVNLQPNGPMSRHIAALQTNDEVEFRGPIGMYAHKPSAAQAQYIYIVSQGVAIAPTLRIVHEILNNEDDVSRVQHITCFRDLANVYFRDTLREFSKYWNYKNHIFVAHQECNDETCAKTGGRGCSGKCDGFLKSLRYKENILTRRLEVTDLSDICCCVEAVAEIIFIIAGGSAFQKSVVEMIQKTVLSVKKDNIFLL